MNQGWGPQQQPGGQWGGQQPGWGPQHGYPQRPPPNNTGTWIAVAVIGGLIAFSIFFSLASKSVVAAIVMIFAGVGAIVACVRFLKTPPIARPIAGISGAVLILSSALGLSAKITATSEAKDTCNRVLYEFTHQKNETMSYDKAMAEFDRLTKEADTGIAACKTAGMLDEASGLEAGKKEVQRQKEAGQAKAKQQAEDDAKAAQAAALAKKEAEWPDTMKAVKKHITDATTMGYSGRWLDAESTLLDAWRQLDELKETKIASSPEWIALKKQVEAQQERIAPQVERVKKKQADDEAKAKKKEDDENAKAALVTAVRGSKPSCGSWSMCASTIKENLNDADSFEFVDSTEVRAEGESWTCAIKFRAKNGFGAKILDARKCWIQQGQVVKMAPLQ